MPLNREAFNLSEGLNAQDIKRFRDKIFILDEEFGCFRFTVESIRGNTEPRYYFLSFPGRKLDKLHVYAEYYEGAFRLIVLISDLTTVYEFDWTDQTHPILLGDYQIGRLLSSVTDQLWLSQDFLLVQTAQENDAARTCTTNLQVYSPGTRLYEACSKEFNTDIRFGPKLNFHSMISPIEARKNILYAQWENDGTTTYMLFL
jgi:hypothetical protein